MRTRGVTVRNEAGFGDNGYYEMMYKDENWKDGTDDREIDEVQHPFVATGEISPSRFNNVQKAITYCILRNGGSCPGEYIVRFLNDHWGYLNANRQKPLEQRPDMRILHINTAVKKDGLDIYKVDPQNRESFMCN